MKNGKFYIGSAKNYKSRWAQHLTELRNNKHSNRHLQNAWNKHGEDNFRFEVVEEVDLADQFKKEQEYLNFLRPFGENGYNISRSTFSDVVGTCIIVKICQNCETDFNTLNNRALICDKCRAEKELAFNGMCFRCTICRNKKLCLSNFNTCNLFLQCFGCEYMDNCNTPSELLEADLCFINTVSDGYLSPDDFWECN